MLQCPSLADRRSYGALCLLALGGITFAIASGCGKSEAASTSGAATDGRTAVGAASVETENYKVEMTAGTAYRADAEGTVDVKLVAKGTYHINAQYPYRFKAADPAPEGLRYPKPVLKREDGTFDEKTAAFKVPFVVARAGKARVSGVLYLSVCSDANCVMDKQAVEVEVDVK